MEGANPVSFWESTHSKTIIPIQRNLLKSYNFFYTKYLLINVKYGIIQLGAF